MRTRQQGEQGSIEGKAATRAEPQHAHTHTHTHAQKREREILSGFGNFLSTNDSCMWRRMRRISPLVLPVGVLVLFLCAAASITWAVEVDPLVVDAWSDDDDDDDGAEELDGTYA